MRLLVFHNILFAHYKSVYFEKIYHEIKNKNGDFLVIQTSIAEKSRLNHFNKNELLDSIKYPFKLISTKPLEEISSLKVLFYQFFYLISFKPTIVNFTGYNSWTIYLLLLYCKILKIKSIVTNESVINNSIRHSLSDNFKFFIKKMILKLPDYFYTFGINANNLLFDLGVNKNRILNFGNTFDKSNFKVDYRTIPHSRSNSEKLKLLFIGRFIPEKNLFNTIEILSAVNQTIPIEFHIYGNGPLGEELAKFILLNNYQFASIHPAVKWSHISSIYPNYDTLILLSNSETWGMVANEATYIGLNVICSNNCGCANDLIINHYNGLVINEANHSDISKQIVAYLKKLNKNESFIKRNNLIFDDSFAITTFIEKIYSIHA